MKNVILNANFVIGLGLIGERIMAMENKQQALLDLFRATLEMLHFLTFVSPKNIRKDRIKYHLDKVKFYMGNFEKEFIKKEKQDGKH